jgi:hypothetical protein
MKTKKSTKSTKTKLAWVDIHDLRQGRGAIMPVASGFASPDLLKFLQRFGLQSQYSIYYGEATK